ncbi:hypothetical protein B0J18DRAFT_412441 [Chaetomium sp. MPI-SDFR-AT-0129]|nr:hypothetical protein B0J18DRAFT_412441 [Chaetomium sp. MPI-SDFR-AT-0129]
MASSTRTTKDLMHDRYRRAVRFWVMPPEKPAKKEGALRFGILGASDSAYTILIKPAEHNPYVVVTAIASHSWLNCKEWSKRYSIPKTYTIYQDLLADPHIDAVLVSCGVHYAFEWTVRSLAQGKHVLLDSPGVGTVAHAERLFNSPLLRAPLPFYPVFSKVMPFRFHPSWLEFEKAIDRERLAHVKVSIVLPVTWELDKDVRFRFEHAGGSKMDVSFGLTLLRSVFGANPMSCAQSRIDLSRRGGEWEGDYEHGSVWQFPQGGIGEVMGTARVDSRLGVPVLCPDAGVTVEVRHFTQTLSPSDWSPAEEPPKPSPPAGSAWEVVRSVKLRWFDGPPSQHSIVVEETGMLYHLDTHKLIKKRSKTKKFRAYRLGRKEEYGASGVTGEVPVAPAPATVVEPTPEESNVNLRHRNSTINTTKKPAPEPVTPHRLLRSKPWWTAPMYQLDSFVNRIRTSRNPDVAKSLALSTIHTAAVPPPWISPTDGLGQVMIREAAYEKANRSPRTSARVGWESDVKRMKFGARLLGIERESDDRRNDRRDNHRDNRRDNHRGDRRDDSQDDGGSESDDGGGDGGGDRVISVGSEGIVARIRRNMNAVMTGAAGPGTGEIRSGPRSRSGTNPNPYLYRPDPTHPTPTPTPAPVPVPALDAQGLPENLPWDLRSRLSAGLELAHELGVVAAVTGPEAAAFVLPWLHGLPDCEWVPADAVDSRLVPSAQEQRWFDSMYSSPPQATTAVTPMDNATMLNVAQPFQDPVGPGTATTADRKYATNPSLYTGRRFIVSDIPLTTTRTGI